MAKGDKPNKGDVVLGKGYKVKSKGIDYTGHIIEVTATYLVLHDSVNRAHRKILLSDIDTSTVDEVDTPWLN